MAEIYKIGFNGIPEGGLCAQTDPESFFPEHGSASRMAKKICRDLCKVDVACLEGALEREEEFGMWGGYNKAERDEILKKRKTS